MITVYVSIGNSDDKLTQAEWAMFCSRVDVTFAARVWSIHGRWYSLPNSGWQNACWCLELEERYVPEIKADLEVIARRYDQESIVWAPAQVTFITPEG